MEIKMEKEFIILPQGMFMKDSGKAEKEMGKDNMFGKMEIDIKENGNNKIIFK